MAYVIPILRNNATFEDGRELIVQIVSILVKMAKAKKLIGEGQAKKGDYSFETSLF